MSSREQGIEKLKKGKFDILVIGGGATGTGIAVDAASRGLSVVLVERFDFSAGTSSRSTKLIHGGVRYREQAVLKFYRSQFKLVRDALHERSTLLKIAPHLVHPLPMLTPIYNRIQVPYYRTGLRLYDRLAGRATIHKSYFVGKKEALQKFPMLKADRLRGGVVYYDGQFDDSRMNICLAVTAREQGAILANYIEVKSLLKQKNRLCGAHVTDRLSGKSWDVHAKVIVNATGPFLDGIRKLDDPGEKPMLSASSGTHIVLDASFSPPTTGLLIPKTEDGRVLFLLPWLGHTLVGTTDNPAPIEENPKPTEEDVEYILRQLRRYFAVAINQKNILSAWTGLRPLVSNPKAVDTARLSRDHVIHVSSSGMVTIAGGKWTTYRKMAYDTVNQAIKVGGLSPRNPSQTEKLAIAGGEKFSPRGFTRLGKEFDLAEDIARHLNQAYGDRAPEVAAYVEKGWGKRLVEGHPFIEAEVLYTLHTEWMRRPVDFLSRRTRLSFLDIAAAEKALPRVADIMAGELDWNADEKKSAIKEARQYWKY